MSAARVLRGVAAAAIVAVAVAGCGRKSDPVRPAAAAAAPYPAPIPLPQDAAGEPEGRSPPPIAAAGPVARGQLNPPSRLSPDRSAVGRIRPRRFEDVFDDSI